MRAPPMTASVVGAGPGPVTPAAGCCIAPVTGCGVAPWAWDACGAGPWEDGGAPPAAAWPPDCVNNCVAIANRPSGVGAAGAGRPPLSAVGVVEALDAADGDRAAAGSVTGAAGRVGAARTVLPGGGEAPGAAGGGPAGGVGRIPAGGAVPLAPWPDGDGAAGGVEIGEGPAVGAGDAGTLDAAGPPAGDTGAFATVAVPDGVAAVVAVAVAVAVAVGADDAGVAGLGSRRLAGIGCRLNWAGVSFAAWPVRGGICRLICRSAGTDTPVRTAISPNWLRTCSAPSVPWPVTVPDRITVRSPCSSRAANSCGSRTISLGADTRPATEVAAAAAPPGGVTCCALIALPTASVRCLRHRRQPRCSASAPAAKFAPERRSAPAGRAG